MELADGDEVIILEVVEEGWWKGKIGHKEGVFPSNFVEELAEDTEPPLPPSQETVDHTPGHSMLIIEHFHICT